MEFTTQVRNTVAAGKFYPAEPMALRECVTHYLDVGTGSPVGAGQNILAAMVPHAGYVFSGRLAGMTLAQADLGDIIVILAPNHSGEGAPFSVWNGAAWKTPLGSVAIDEPFSTMLVESACGFAPDTAAHLRDHAIEVILPFLQILRPQSTVVPVSIGAYSPGRLAALGAVLASSVVHAQKTGRRVSIVVSSDMNHFKSHDETLVLDRLALEKIQAVDPQGLLDTVRNNAISMCGVLPMSVALYACRHLGARAALLLGHTTSGESGRRVGAGKDRVVGYAGVLVPEGSPHNGE